MPEHGQKVCAGTIRVGCSQQAHFLSLMTGFHAQMQYEEFMFKYEYVNISLQIFDTSRLNFSGE